MTNSHSKFIVRRAIPAAAATLLFVSFQQQLQVAQPAAFWGSSHSSSPFISPSFLGKLDTFGSTLSSRTSLLQCEGIKKEAQASTIQKYSPQLNATCIRQTLASQTNEKRTFQTKAEQYFAQHGELPAPAQMHAILPISPIGKGVLIIGDVHGCFDEMVELYEKARIEENGGAPFQAVVLLGDLCMKGPYSAAVVRWVRLQTNWYAIRGNNDESALKAILGDLKRLEKDNYAWVRGDEGQSSRVSLSDDDIEWLANLPYTFTIDESLIHSENITTEEENQPRYSISVHAGLLPDVQALEDQDIHTMVHLREIDNEPWASTWKRSDVHVYFGHDARRGLQLENPFATGLDTGVVYGKQLSGIILPARKIVQVQAKEVYEPIRVARS